MLSHFARKSKSIPETESMFKYCRELFDKTPPQSCELMTSPEHIL